MRGLQHQHGRYHPKLWLRARRRRWSASGTESIYGNPVTLTATVAVLMRERYPTGTVQFFDGGATRFEPVVGGDGHPHFQRLSGGSHSITAAYGGDVNFAGSLSVPMTQVVTPGATATVVVSSGPSVYGDPVTFTATVSVVAAIGSPRNCRVLRRPHEPRCEGARGWHDGDPDHCPLAAVVTRSRRST